MKKPQKREVTERVEKPKSTAFRQNISPQHYAQLLGDLEGYIREVIGQHLPAAGTTDADPVHTAAVEILDIVLKHGAMKNDAVKGAFRVLQPRINAEFDKLLLMVPESERPDVALENQQIINLIMGVGDALKKAQTDARETFDLT